mmetsp:Transcript_17411/g.45467  ORF Transcript_17411/g.45467 Transcript_17411/m.45467 type:complete len:449 (-) Transcript_17411:128-1474(-)|eukprot:CAMPEP_0182925044 /NCGR_PEP_ID=MMETSP0105_2-20130417/8098_1 /TAXON_ID=81532 ORGANISM="Acanthoeca-like sp., Strain 10tr" /NCGR_SAMPLE_ID=MMETSP0105_2 /ASSEMBLY_ACC=CAM_ASM_000205 /LENGTH=448 /DNA_ID=CAMNT_0025062877 /DNA_START=248 /DNA_END=1594 /DNA_ORIENTATION=-
MAKMVNVNREVKDTFYRYKMPMVICKIEGRGNGIKTAIPNMVEIAKALERPPAYPTKYLGVELGAQTQMYAADERYIVNGAFEASRFQEVLDGFIKKFVLCEACSNPETVLKVTKKKEIESSCKACGHRYFMKQTHKLCTFIINNPPDGSATNSKKGRSKEERRRAKRGEAPAAEAPVAAAEEDKDDADAAPGNADPDDLVADAAAASPALDEEEDMEWSVDTSDEAARARAADLAAGVTSLTMTADLEKTMEERLKIFEGFVTGKMAVQPFPATAVVAEAQRLDCKERGVKVLVGLLMKDGDVLTNLKRHQGIFQRFTFENGKAEKHCLAAFEGLIGTRPDELIPVTARIFMNLYEMDIVSEDRFIAWADKASKKNVGSAELAKKIQGAAKKFIDWLREAEEEESDEDESIAFETAQETKNREAEAQPAEAAAAEEEAEEDIDIDNI